MWSLVCELVIPSLIFLHLQHGDNNTYLTALFGGINDNVQKILATEAGIIVAVSIIVGYCHPHGYFCDRKSYYSSETQAWSSGQLVHGTS